MNVRKALGLLATHLFLLRLFLFLLLVLIPLGRRPLASLGPTKSTKLAWRFFLETKEAGKVVVRVGW